METVSKDIAEHKATLKKLQGDLSTLLMVMESCPCKDKKFLLAQTKKFASLLAAHATGKGSDDDEPLYFKIEELEEKRNDLNEELTDEIGSFGMKQRRLLHQIDMVEAKMNRQSSKADMYEHTDQNMAKGVKRQKKAMADYLAHKKSQLERIEKDVEAAQAKYDDLEKAMGKCGCGPAL
jgi:DNA repair exonuclease SbcCD ATPase subunit